MKIKVVSLATCFKCGSEVTELWEGTDICTDCSVNIIASFDYVNATRGWRIGEDEPQETRFETTGELFKFCLKEYGRCTSKMYVTENGKDKHIGWVFEKMVKYTDCDEKYLQETWVTIHKALPERKVTYHYAEL